VSGASPAAEPEPRPNPAAGGIVLFVLLSLAGAWTLAARRERAPVDVAALRTEVLTLDGLAQEAWVRAQKEPTTVLGPPAGREIAARVERDVRPFLRWARRSVARAGAGDVPAAQRPLLDSLRALVDAREAAYAAITEVLREPGPRAAVASRTRMEEADRRRAEIEAAR
jgi:hypothetical protein